MINLRHLCCYECVSMGFSMWQLIWGSAMPSGRVSDKGLGVQNPLPPCSDLGHFKLTVTLIKHVALPICDKKIDD